MILTCGCSALVLEKGITLELEKNNAYREEILSAYTIHISGAKPYVDLKETRDHPTIYITLKSDRSQRLISIGPGLLLPIPIIPFPVWQSKTFNAEEYLDTNVNFQIYFSGYKRDYSFNPYKTFIQINDVSFFPSKVIRSVSQWNGTEYVTTNPEISENDILTIDKNNRHLRLEFLFETKYKDVLGKKLIIKGLMTESNIIEIPTIIFMYEEGINLSWFWGGIDG